jgi:hypothetical protein
MNKCIRALDLAVIVLLSALIAAAFVRAGGQLGAAQLQSQAQNPRH